MSSSTGSRAPTVLLVEDHAADRAIVERFLELNPPERGMRWQIAEVDQLKTAIQRCNTSDSQNTAPQLPCPDGNKTAHLAATTPIDVVLLDLGLPDSHGLKTFKHFRNAVQHLPVVILTGLADGQLGINALQAGAQDCLFKDTMTGARLGRSLQYAIARQQSQSQQFQDFQNQAKGDLRVAQSLNDLNAKILLMLLREIRTPLSMIGAVTQVFQTALEVLSIEQREDYLRQANRAVQKALILVQDAYKLHQSQSGTLSYTSQPIDVIQVIKSIVNQLQNSTDRSPEITLEAPTSFLQIETDLDLFIVLFRNLLVNAVRYSPDGGTIDLSIHSDTASIIFEICDQGIGIPPEELALVYQSFYRASNVGSIPGRGIGLTVAKACVERHGGTIAITSQVGQGTQVKVCLLKRTLGSG